MALCAVAGCHHLKVYRATGYCAKHEYHFKKYGDPLKYAEVVPPEVTVEPAPVALAGAAIPESSVVEVPSLPRNYLHIAIDIAGETFSFEYQIPDAPGNIQATSLNRGWIDEHIRAALKPQFGRMVEEV